MVKSLIHTKLQRQRYIWEFVKILQIYLIHHGRSYLSYHPMSKRKNTIASGQEHMIKIMVQQHCQDTKLKTLDRLRDRVKGEDGRRVG